MGNKLKSRIVFFTKYTPKGPSSRYRTFQYIPYFREKYNVVVHSFFDDGYLEAFEKGIQWSKFDLVKNIVKRFWEVLFKTSKKDLVFIEYELIPYFPPVLEWFLKIRGIKYILDYDDAIFHNYDLSKNKVVLSLLKNKIPKIMRWSNHIVTGSPYLTTTALGYNNNVTEIPTSTSSDLYSLPNESMINPEGFVIGWIGSKSTSKNILGILPALRELSKVMSFKLNLVGFDNSLANQLEGINYQVIDWEKEKEISEIRKFTVGIMPLDDTPFNQGKCGFKLVQYMACGLPTISSPLVANIKINRSRLNLHANEQKEWVDSIKRVFEEQELYRKVGKENYQDFIAHYSTQNNQAVYLELFNKIIQ